MLLYNQRKEFIGIDTDDLSSLGFANLNELLSEANDFADLFVNRQSRAFIKLDAQISIRNAVTGGTRYMTIQTDHNTAPVSVEIPIPIGTRQNETVTYPNLVGNNIDLHVTFHIIPDMIWTIDGIDLNRKENFSFWDLINGATRDVDTITGGKVRVKIPPLTQPGTKLKLKSLGGHSRNNHMIRGDMYVEVVAKLPKDIPESILSRIKDL